MLYTNMPKNVSIHTSPLTDVESVGYLWLPTTGIWRLDVCVDGYYIEIIIIEVL